MDRGRNRRELTPAQRKAKNERERRRRLKDKAEFERLKKTEAELQALAVSLRNENGHLREENERLNAMLANSKITHQLHEQNLGLYEKNLELEQTMRLVGTLVTNNSASPNGEVATNEPITQCPGNSQSAIQYADELVEDFIKKLDAKEKSNVDFSDFDGLKEEMETSGINSLPPSLAPFETRIKEHFGEIAADSTQSSCTAMPSRILFYAAIREMDNSLLGEIDERKILLWRDAINSALNINFKVEFAIIHLKKIARAYFGLKAWNEQFNDPELMRIVRSISELVTKQRALEAKHAQIVEERNSEMRNQCVLDAEYFADKFLTAGLLDQHPSS